MDERDSASAPTAVERPGASDPDTVREPSTPTVRERPRTVDGHSASAFDPPRDRFETKAELGRGGMGRVDEAYDRALGRAVAIKHMLAPGGTELARFEREARITARLEHPGIVPIHDAGRSPDGTPYYVMRRVDGQPLSELTSGTSLDERLALVPNLLAACDAAGFAHARGVVHRDIKPTNILIGPFGETLLIDWGLARELDEREGGEPAVVPSQPELTRAGTVAGTPGFMSPEQARGETVDARADVFALGVTLFYVLSGKLPWSSTSATEMVNVVGAGREPAWDLLPAEVPVDLRAVLEKAMAAEPAERYADGSALAADLRRYITGNLVGARQYGPFARFIRFVQRHRAAVAVAGISLAVVAVIAVISVRRVIAERDDAHAARALAEQREREMADSADVLLVDNARQLAQTNPIAAITKLRKLRPESRRWREAWAAASTAWFNGIPFGFVNEHGPALLETAADSRHVLISNLRTGTLVVVDLIERKRREVAKLGRVFRCTWLDAGKAVLCQRAQDAVLVDVTTGALESVGIAIDGMVGDRGSRVLVRNRETRQLLEVRADRTAPVVVLEDIDEFTASTDLEWLVVRRGVDIVLHHGAKRWMLPWKTDTPNQTAPVTDVRDGLVTALLREELKSVQVVDDKLVELATIPRGEKALGVASATGRSFVVDLDGVSIIEQKGRYVPRQMRVRGYYMTRRGFVVSGADGEIAIRDELGWFELGRRPMTYRSVDQSSDGRFVTAIADSGDLLAWDLRGPRGRQVLLDRSETPQHIDDKQLWLTEAGGGVHLRSLTDGTRRELVTNIGPLARLVFDPYARFVSVTEPGDPYTYVYDAITGRTRKIEAPILNVGIDGRGMGYVLPDRTLWRWTPGPAEKEATKLGQFPLLPSFMAIAGDYVVGIVEPREVMRLDATTGRVDRTVIEGEVLRVAVELGGRTWLLSETHAWRWDLGAATPIRLESPEPYTEMTALKSGVLLASSKSLTLVDGDRRRILSTSPGRYIVMDDELVASLAPTAMLGVIDLQTAQRIEVPMRTTSTGTLVAHGNRFGAMTGNSSKGATLTYWDLEVPREPAALQHWLTTITNATPIPDSDAVAWPGN